VADQRNVTQLALRLAKVKTLQRGQDHGNQYTILTSPKKAQYYARGIDVVWLYIRLKCVSFMTIPARANYSSALIHLYLSSSLSLLFHALCRLSPTRPPTVLIGPYSSRVVLARPSWSNKGKVGKFGRRLIWCHDNDPAEMHDAYGRSRGA
jgi:hypothetical protein